MRLDRFLWWARLTKTRAQAQALAEEGHLRLDGRAVDRSHAEVRVGSVVALPLHGRVRVLRVETLPTRRGPPAEARALYADLVDAGAAPSLGPRVPPAPESPGP